MKPCPVLKDALVGEMQLLHPDGPIAELMTGGLIGYLNTPVLTFPKLKTDATPIATERRTGSCVGFKVPLGNGEVYVFGFGWMHRSDTQWRALKAFLGSLGCVNPAVSSNPDIYTTVIREGEREWLFVSNPWETACETELDWKGTKIPGQAVPAKAVVCVASRAAQAMRKR